MDELNKLRAKIRNFVAERNWDQFHSPKNLCMALASEIGELSDIFQWLTDEKTYLARDSREYKQAQEELADIFIYLLLLSEKLDIDLIQSALKKVEENANKYPIELSKNNAKKYTELEYK